MKQPKQEAIENESELRRKLRKRVCPTKYTSAYIPDADRYTYPIEGVLEAVNKLKEEGFPESLMNIKVNTDGNDKIDHVLAALGIDVNAIRGFEYDDSYSSIELTAQRPKTEAEIDGEIRQWEEIEKVKRQEQHKNKKMRETNEKRMYERLKKKFEGK